MLCTPRRVQWLKKSPMGGLLRRTGERLRSLIRPCRIVWASWDSFKPKNGSLATRFRLGMKQ